MKKNRIFCIICILIFTMINSMPSFAAESGDDYEDITEEYTYGDTTSEASENAAEEESYPSHFFNDTTIPGIIIEANVGEGIIPAQTSIRTKLVSSEVEERVKNSIEGFFNGDQKTVKITAVQITFLYNDVEIDYKGSVNIIMRSDQALEGANHVVVCLKDDQAELLPASQSVIDDYAVNDEGISLRKKEFSFELKGNATIAIVEIEDVPANQKKTDTSEIPSEATSETKDTETPEPSSETKDTEKPEPSSETKDTETPEPSSETKDTETPEPSSETEDTKTPEPSSETEDTKTPEPSSKQKEEKTKVTVEIIWDDANNQDCLRPENVKVELFADSNKKLEKRISEKYTFEVPKYNESGKEIKYEITVATPYGYKLDKKEEGNHFIIKYSHEPDKVEVKGKVIWKNTENSPDVELKVTLYADNVEKSAIKTSKKKNWEFDLGEYPKYKDSKKVQYKVKIEPIEGYNTTYSEGSFDITNEYAKSSNSDNRAPKVGDINRNRILFYILIAIASLAIVCILIYCLEGFFDNF